MLCCYSISPGIFRDVGCCNKGVTDAVVVMATGSWYRAYGLVIHSLLLSVLQMVHVGCSGRERPIARSKGSGRCNLQLLIKDLISYANSKQQQAGSAIGYINLLPKVMFFLFFVYGSVKDITCIHFTITELLHVFFFRTPLVQLRFN
jgi:hypothetical protein